MVELLFLPSVYAPCPICKGTRYNAKTLDVNYRGQSIADVLGMTVDTAYEFFDEEASVKRALGVLREVGLGYLRLGQPATELSGGEAQRSSSPLSCSAFIAETRSTFWTNLQRDSIRQTWNG